MTYESSDDDATYEGGRGFDRYRYTQVPQWVMLHPQLSDLGYRVYCILLSRVNSERSDTKVWPKQQTIADMLARHRNTIGKVVAEELVKLDMVSVKVERYGPNNTLRRNNYYIHIKPPQDWEGCASVFEWDAENGKTAGQPGRTLSSASGGTVESASGRTAERATGRTAACAENKTKNKQDEGKELGAAAPETSPPDPAVVERLCRALADAVKDNGVKRPKITYAWREAAAQLLTPDEDGHAYTVEEIEGGIAWAQASEFWASKTTTMAKFAKHFDQMLIQARSSVPKPRPSEAAQEDAGGDLEARRDQAMDSAEIQLEEALGRPLTAGEVQSLRDRIREQVQ